MRYNNWTSVTQAAGGSASSGVDLTLFQWDRIALEVGTFTSHFDASSTMPLIIQGRYSDDGSWRTIDATTTGGNSIIPISGAAYVPQIRVHTDATASIAHTWVVLGTMAQ